MGETSLSDSLPPVSNGESIPVALIEDNRLVREGIATLLEDLPDLRIVAKAASTEASLLRRVNPRVVLLDLGLRQGNSLRLVQTVKEECPEARVIVMDLLPIHEDIAEFVHAGVSGFIMKDATIEDLVDTIRMVAQGIPVLPPQMTGALFSQIAREAVSSGRPKTLEAVRMTSRERDVINLIAEGESNKAIARRLHISPHTDKSHVRNIMEKLTLHTRLQIAAYAHQTPESGPESE
jgi:DNA-binding NarL/FixJ family response regulator